MPRSRRNNDLGDKAKRFEETENSIKKTQRQIAFAFFGLIFLPAGTGG